MSRTAPVARVGDLGITKALHYYGSGSPTYADFGVQTFLDGTPFTFGIRMLSANPLMTDDGNIWAYGFSSGGDRGYCMRPNATTRKFQVFYGNGSANAVNYIPIGKHYMFAEFDGASTLRLYRDTTLKDTLTISGKISDGTIKTYLGSRDGTARYFQGVLGDGCIYSRILTAAEKLAIVTRASYPTSGAQILIRSNENTGTTLTDYSGNGRNGTITMGGGFWRNSPFNA